MLIQGAERRRDHGGTLIGLHILLVDDDPMMLHMLPPHLQELDTNPRVAGVLTAQTPVQALEELARMPPEPIAVLSDFNLKAELNGVDLLTEVAKRRPEAVRILFSGYAREQIGDVGSADVTHGFVEKPLRIREMLPPIAEIIARRLATGAS